MVHSFSYVLRIFSVGFRSILTTRKSPFRAPESVRVVVGPALTRYGHGVYIGAAQGLSVGPS